MSRVEVLSSRVVKGISWSPLSGLKGDKPPVEFGQRTRDCSLGHEGNEGHQLAMMGNLEVFLELRRQCGVFHEVRWGAQEASRVVPGK